MTYDPRRDDLMFQSAQSDGKGGLRPPYMRDLSDRLPPMAPRLPLIDASGPAKATPDPRDALIAELCEALEYAKADLEAARILIETGFTNTGEVAYGIRQTLERVSAALRRARGLA